MENSTHNFYKCECGEFYDSTFPYEEVNCLNCDNKINLMNSKQIAELLAYYFVNSDIPQLGRSFDNLLENGSQPEIIEEFSNIFMRDENVSYCCLHKYPNNQFFSLAMLNEKAKTFIISKKE